MRDTMTLVNPRMHAIIAAKGMSDPDEVYKAAKSYADLKYATVAYLQGKVYSTLHHLGPISEETVPLVDDLVRINAHGFISISGQPACRSTEFIADTWKCFDGNDCGNWYEEWEQRSYIDGFMPKADLNGFRSHIARFSESFHYMVHGSSDPGSAINTFPKGRCGVTRMRVHADKAMLGHAPWETATMLPYDASQSEYDVYKVCPELHKVLLKHTCFISIAGTEYGQGSVEELLLDFYEGRAERDAMRAACCWC